jgi:hypothetical protein
MCTDQSMVFAVILIEMYSTNKFNIGGFNKVAAGNVVPCRRLYCEYFIQLKTILIELAFLRRV